MAITLDPPTGPELDPLQYLQGSEYAKTAFAKRLETVRGGASNGYYVEVVL